MTRQFPLFVLTFLALAAAVSINLSAAEPATPFNGKDLSGWKLRGDAARSSWTVGTAKMDSQDPKQLQVSDDGCELINAKGHGVDIYSEAKFGDAVIELEVMVPQGSNSGIYVMGEYEVQVLDSYGREQLGMGDMGAIYSASVPSTNAAKQPGQWQQFVIDYQAPRFDDAGKKTVNARVLKITLNGQTIQDDVELKGPTPGGISGKESATGPIMFQGDHGAVAYRNIKVTAK